MIANLPRLLSAALLISALLPGARPAAAAIGDWAEGDRTRVRLVAAAAGAEGKLDAAIEIELAPGWKTYWRTPGDAGIAPRFDFSRSANIVAPVVRFPVPERYDDGYSVTNVFRDRVVLSVDARIADPAAPADLRVSLDLGVCDEICIPVHVEADLAVSVGGADDEAATIVAAARKALAGPALPGVFAVDRISRAGGTDRKPVFEIAATVPDAETATVFVEGPPDWSAAPPELVSTDGSRAVYRVAFSRLGAETPIAGSAFVVTIVSDGRAVEQGIGLD
jgi:suppressor for copper-sensitivity B